MVLTGARQVGKSTLLKHEFPDFSYCTLDDFTVQEQAKVDPQSLWGGTDRLIIDEAQKLPRLSILPGYGTRAIANRTRLLEALISYRFYYVASCHLW